MAFSSSSGLTKNRKNLSEIGNKNVTVACGYIVFLDVTCRLLSYTVPYLCRRDKICDIKFIVQQIEKYEINLHIKRRVNIL